MSCPDCLADMEEVTTKLWSFLTEVFDYLEDIGDIIPTIITSLDNLYEEIEAIEFTADSVIYQLLGNVKFFIGNTLYTALFATMTLGCMFFLYKLCLNLYKAVKESIEIDFNKLKLQ